MLDMLFLFFTLSYALVIPDYRDMIDRISDQLQKSYKFSAVQLERLREVQTNHKHQRRVEMDRADLIPNVY